MKYVILAGSGGIASCLLFSDTLVHKTQTDASLLRPVSAGFCILNISGTISNSSISMKCYGRSESLNLDSIPERDAKIIQKHLMNFQALVDFV